jgi:hypothetical protein
MNKSKIIALTGLATVMSASAAMAGQDSVSINGYIEGFVNTGDDTTGISNTVSSQSIYVTYTKTLENDMGLTIGFTLTDATHAAGFSLDTDIGTFSTGTDWQMNSAADAMDGLPNNANVTSSAQVLGTYDDGDPASGEGVRWMSNPIGESGWTIAASLGEDTNAAAESDRITSIAASGSIGPVSVALGAVDQMGASDDSFLTLGYTLGSVGLGYGIYDSDDDESTAISAMTEFAGLTVGVRFDDLDANVDNDQMLYSVGKELGGMSLTLMYSEQDVADSSNW